MPRTAPRFRSNHTRSLLNLLTNPCSVARARGQERRNVTSSITCHLCGGVGHLKRDCQMNRNPDARFQMQTQGPPRTAMVRQVAPPPNAQCELTPPLMRNLALNRAPRPGSAPPPTPLRALICNPP